MFLGIKKAFDLPFSWLFAIIAGGFILFIVIYATSNFIGISQTVEGSQSAQQLLNYFNPVVNGITSGQTVPPIVFKKDTRIYFGCSVSSSKSVFFGRETINFSEQSGFLQKWTEQSISVSRYNKYIFTENMEEGKKFYIFSKPFFAGFKVDDLIVMSSDNYCFIGAPSVISDDVTGLQLVNVNVSETINSCSKDSVKVCFGSTFSGCNMSVYPDSTGDYDKGYVMKNGKSLNYFGSLIYGAIFSSPEIYECNVKRLGNKISELADIYSEKISIIQQKDCNSLVSPNLELMKQIVNSANSSLGFVGIYDIVKDMNQKNCDVNSDCWLYSPEKC